MRFPTALQFKRSNSDWIEVYFLLSRKFKRLNLTHLVAIT